MAESLINFLIPKLNTWLSQEYTLLQGLERDVQYIRDELGSMRAFIRIAEAKQDADVLNDEQKEWFKQVMEVAYDTEDVVDRFFLRFSHRNNAAGFRGHVRHMYTSVKNLPARHQIGSKISDIKYRVEQISARHQRYQSIEGVSETSFRRDSEHPIRGHALLIKEADLVGIDPPKKKIVSLILTDESHLKAVSVVGMGGLGKTTLVKRVFENSEIKNAFSARAWLTISETFIIEDALKNLIHQLFKESKQPISGEVESMDRDGLRAFVKDFLGDKRYIIVLDDLWKLKHWDSIKYVFPDDSCGSRIIITTRMKDVATTCCHECRGNVHEMLPLSTDDSWKLFCEKTFENGDCPPHLEEISRRIMSKCEGLPLGIVAIGGLLASKDTSKLMEWEMVLRSLGGELEGVGGKLNQVRKILLLSYNDMPYYLKSCLLYMGIFPDDAIVSPWELKLFWIAEGFVQVRPGMTNLEVAQSYLNELVGRSLIQVTSTYFDGKMQDCRVHDLTYKIILSKCKELRIQTRASTPNTTYPENVRRLVFDESTFLKEHGRLSCLRSLIRSKKSLSNLSDSSLSLVLRGTSKLLRVLHLESSQLNIIPKEVFKLHNLTYLNLEDTNVTDIPNSIRNLQNLEYLNLQNTNVHVLPADIIMLKKLFVLAVSRELVVEGSSVRTSGFKAPNGIGGLFSLHYLSCIETDGIEVIREIGKLTQLRGLSITKITGSNERELCSSLERLTNMQHLTIQALDEHSSSPEMFDLEYSSFSTTHQFLHTLYLGVGLVKIPHWVSLCHDLSMLNLVNSRLSDDPLGSLEGLPNLVDLHLDNAYLGDVLNFKARGFQKLKRLWLCNLSGLKFVIIEKGTLPYLESFMIEKCTLLQELPKDIQYLRKLWILRLYDMPERLVNSLQSLDKDNHYPKIAHTEIIVGLYINGKWKGEYLKC